MTDAELRDELLSIMATPMLERYARKTIGIRTVARYAGLSYQTIYQFAWGNERVTRESRDLMKQALSTLAMDGSGKKHPRMRKHGPLDAAGVAPGPSIAKAADAAGHRGVES